MKKVYTDVSVLIRSAGLTGIPRVVMEVCRRLYKNKDIDATFLEYNEAKQCFNILDPEKFVSFCETKSDDRKGIRSGKRIDLDGLEKDSVFFDPDGIWKSRLNRSYLYPVLKRCEVKIIPLVHDIIGITHPQYCREDDIVPFMEYIAAVMMYADKITVTTRTTESYITKLYSELNRNAPMSEKKKFAEKICIVPLGGDFKAGQMSERKKKSGKRPYLLSVGTIEPRKNQELLIKAYDGGLRDIKMDLVLAGRPGWNTEELMQKIRNHPDLGKGLRYLDNASDSELDELYEDCFALVFPSHIEGYGLPIIEAFEHGVPVLLSDTPINHEVAGERGSYFGEDSPEELVELVSSLTKDPKKYEKLQSAVKDYKPISWDETAERIAKVLLG